jgi:hypothetical protein
MFPLDSTILFAAQRAKRAHITTETHHCAFESHFSLTVSAGLFQRLKICDSEH